MDPNENLAEQRRIVERIQSGRHSMRSGDVARLAELVEALDEWLSAGGRLPQAWERKP